MCENQQDIDNKQNNINCDTYETVLNRTKTGIDSMNGNIKMKSHVPCSIISKTDHRTVIPINQNKLESILKNSPDNQTQDHHSDNDFNIFQHNKKQETNLNNPNSVINLNDIQNSVNINETVDSYESKEYFGKTFKALFPYTSPNHLNEQNTNYPNLFAVNDDLHRSEVIVNKGISNITQNGTNNIDIETFLQNENNPIEPSNINNPSTSNTEDTISPTDKCDIKNKISKTNNNNKNFETVLDKKPSQVPNNNNELYRLYLQNKLMQSAVNAKASTSANRDTGQGYREELEKYINRNSQILNPQDPRLRHRLRHRKMYECNGSCQEQTDININIEQNPPTKTSEDKQEKNDNINKQIYSQTIISQHQPNVNRSQSEYLAELKKCIDNINGNQKSKSTIVNENTEMLLNKSNIPHQDLESMNNITNQISQRHEIKSTYPINFQYKRHPSIRNDASTNQIQKDPPPYRLPSEENVSSGIKNIVSKQIPIQPRPLHILNITPETSVSSTTPRNYIVSHPSINDTLSIDSQYQIFLNQTSRFNNPSNLIQNQVIQQPSRNVTPSVDSQPCQNICNMNDSTTTTKNVADQEVSLNKSNENIDGPINTSQLVPDNKNIVPNHRRTTRSHIPPPPPLPPPPLPPPLPPVVNIRPYFHFVPHQIPVASITTDNISRPHSAVAYNHMTIPQNFSNENYSRSHSERYNHIPNRLPIIPPGYHPNTSSRTHLNDAYSSINHTPNQMTIIPPPDSINALSRSHLERLYSHMSNQIPIIPPPDANNSSFRSDLESHYNHVHNQMTAPPSVYINNNIPRSHLEGTYHTINYIPNQMVIIPSPETPQSHLKPHYNHLPNWMSIIPPIQPNFTLHRSHLDTPHSLNQMTVPPSAYPNTTSSRSKKRSSTIHHRPSRPIQPTTDNPVTSSPLQTIPVHVIQKLRYDQTNNTPVNQQITLNKTNIPSGIEIIPIYNNENRNNQMAQRSTNQMNQLNIKNIPPQIIPHYRKKIAQLKKRNETNGIDSDKNINCYNRTENCESTNNYDPSKELPSLDCNRTEHRYEIIHDASETFLNKNENSNEQRTTMNNQLISRSTHRSRNRYMLQQNLNLVQYNASLEDVRNKSFLMDNILIANGGNLTSKGLVINTDSSTSEVLNQNSIMIKRNHENRTQESAITNTSTQTSDISNIVNRTPGLSITKSRASFANQTSELSITSTSNLSITLNQKSDLPVTSNQKADSSLNKPSDLSITISRTDVSKSTDQTSNLFDNSCGALNLCKNKSETTADTKLLFVKKNYDVIQMSRSEHNSSNSHSIPRNIRLEETLDCNKSIHILSNKNIDINSNLHEPQSLIKSKLSNDRNNKMNNKNRIMSYDSNEIMGNDNNEVTSISNNEETSNRSNEMTRNDNSIQYDQPINLTNNKYKLPSTKYSRVEPMEFFYEDISDDETEITEREVDAFEISRKDVETARRENGRFGTSQKETGICEITRSESSRFEMPKKEFVINRIPGREVEVDYDTPGISEKGAGIHRMPGRGVEIERKEHKRLGVSDKEIYIRGMPEKEVGTSGMPGIQIEISRREDGKLGISGKQGDINGILGGEMGTSEIQKDVGTSGIPQRKIEIIRRKDGRFEIPGRGILIARSEVGRLGILVKEIGTHGNLGREVSSLGVTGKKVGVSEIPGRIAEIARREDCIFGVPKRQFSTHGMPSRVIEMTRRENDFLGVSKKPVNSQGILGRTIPIVRTEDNRNGIPVKEISTYKIQERLDGNLRVPEKEVGIPGRKAEITGINSRFEVLEREGVVPSIPSKVVEVETRKDDRLDIPVKEIGTNETPGREFAIDLRTNRIIVPAVIKQELRNGIMNLNGNKTEINLIANNKIAKNLEIINSVNDKAINGNKKVVVNVNEIVIGGKNKVVLGTMNDGQLGSINEGYEEQACTINKKRMDCINERGADVIERRIDAKNEKDMVGICLVNKPENNDVIQNRISSTNEAEIYSHERVNGDSINVEKKEDINIYEAIVNEETIGQKINEVETTFTNEDFTTVNIITKGVYKNVNEKESNNKKEMNENTITENILDKKDESTCTIKIPDMLNEELSYKEEINETIPGNVKLNVNNNNMEISVDLSLNDEYDFDAESYKGPIDNEVFDLFVEDHLNHGDRSYNTDHFENTSKVIQSELSNQLEDTERKPEENSFLVDKKRKNLNSQTQSSKKIKKNNTSSIKIRGQNKRKQVSMFKTDEKLNKYFKSIENVEENNKTTGPSILDNSLKRRIVENWRKDVTLNSVTIVEICNEDELMTKASFDSEESDALDYVDSDNNNNKKDKGKNIERSDKENGVERETNQGDEISDGVEQRDVDNKLGDNETGDEADNELKVGEQCDDALENEEQTDEIESKDNLEENVEFRNEMQAVDEQGDKIQDESKEGIDLILEIQENEETEDVQGNQKEAGEVQDSESDDEVVEKYEQGEEIQEDNDQKMQENEETDNKLDIKQKNEDAEQKMDEDHNMKKNKQKLNVPKRIRQRTNRKHNNQRNSIKENIKPKPHKKRKVSSAESNPTKRVKKDNKSTNNEPNLDLIEIANILGDDFRIPRASRLKAEAKMSKYINILTKKKSHGRRMMQTKVPTSDDEKDFIRIQTVAQIHCEPRRRLRLDSERSFMSTASNFTNYELIPTENTGLVVKLRKTSTCRRKNLQSVGTVYKRFRYENRSTNNQEQKEIIGNKREKSVIKNNSVINSSLVNKNSIYKNNLVFNNEHGECSGYKNNLVHDEDSKDEDDSIYGQNYESNSILDNNSIYEGVSVNEENFLYEDTSIFGDETDSESRNKLDSSYQKDTTESESDSSEIKRHKNKKIKKQIKYPIILQTNNYNKPKFIHTSPVKRKKKKMKDLKKEEIKRKVFLKKRFYLRNSNVSYKKYFSGKDSNISVILNKNRKSKILSADKKKYWKDVTKNIKNSRNNPHNQGSSKSLHRKNKIIAERNKKLLDNKRLEGLSNYRQYTAEQSDGASNYKESKNLPKRQEKLPKNNQLENSSIKLSEELLNTNQLKHLPESNQLENHSNRLESSPDFNQLDSTPNIETIKTNPVQIVFVDIQLIKPFTITLNPSEMLSQINTTEDSELILDSCLPNENVLNLENESPAINIIDNLLLDLGSRNLNDILLNQESSGIIMSKKNEEKSWLSNIENADVIFSNEEILENVDNQMETSRDVDDPTDEVQVNKKSEVRKSSVESVTVLLTSSTSSNEEFIVDSSITENKSLLEKDQFSSIDKSDKSETEKDKSSPEEDTISSEENKSLPGEDKSSSGAGKASFEEKKSLLEEYELVSEEHKSLYEADKCLSEENKVSCEEDKYSFQESKSTTEKDGNADLNTNNSSFKDNTSASDNIGFSEELMTILRMNVETILNIKQKPDPLSRHTRPLKIIVDEDFERTSNDSEIIGFRDATGNKEETTDLGNMENTSGIPASISKEGESASIGKVSEVVWEKDSVDKSKLNEIISNDFTNIKGYFNQDDNATEKSINQDDNSIEGSINYDDYFTEGSINSDDDLTEEYINQGDNSIERSSNQDDKFTGSIDRDDKHAEESIIYDNFAKGSVNRNNNSTEGFITQDNNSLQESIHNSTKESINQKIKFAGSINGNGKCAKGFINYDNFTERCTKQNNNSTEFINQGNLLQSNQDNKSIKTFIHQCDNSIERLIDQNDKSEESLNKHFIEIQKKRDTAPDALSRDAFSHFVDTVCDSVEDTIKEEVETDGNKKKEIFHNDNTVISLTLPSPPSPQHSEIVLNNTMELKIYEITNKLKDALVKYHLKTRGETYEIRKKRFFNSLRNKFKEQNYMELLDVISELLQSLRDKVIDKLEDNPVIEVKNVISIDSNVIFNLQERKMEAVDCVTNYTAHCIKAILCNIFNLDKFNDNQTVVYTGKDEKVESIETVEENVIPIKNIYLTSGKVNESDETIKKESEESVFQRDRRVSDHLRNQDVFTSQKNLEKLTSQRDSVGLTCKRDNSILTFVRDNDALTGQEKNHELTPEKNNNISIPQKDNEASILQRERTYSIPRINKISMSERENNLSNFQSKHLYSQEEITSSILSTPTQNISKSSENEDTFVTSRTVSSREENTKNCSIENATLSLNTVTKHKVTPNSKCSKQKNKFSSCKTIPQKEETSSFSFKNRESFSQKKQKTQNSISFIATSSASSIPHKNVQRIPQSNSSSKLLIQKPVSSKFSRDIKENEMSKNPNVSIGQYILNNMRIETDISVDSLNIKITSVPFQSKFHIKQFSSNNENEIDKEISEGNEIKTDIEGIYNDDEISNDIEVIEQTENVEQKEHESVILISDDENARDHVITISDEDD